MGGFSKILVAFDDSGSSRNALAQAIAAMPDSWIKVLAVVPVYDGDLELVGVRDVGGLLRGPRGHLLRSAQEIAGADSGRVRIGVEQGDAFEKIVAGAEEEGCSLIVMGRRGLHNLERMLMGSVTAKVIVHSGMDVLVVPGGVDISWDRVLVATDGSVSSQAAVARAIGFAQKHGGLIDLVSVVDMYPEFYADAPQVVEKLERRAVAVLEESRAQVTAAGVKAETELLRGDPADEIRQYARKSGGGIVFVGSRGQSGLKKVFLGNVAQKIIGLSPSAVLVAKRAV